MLILKLHCKSGEKKSSGAIKLACHQDLCKARVESNFGPEATGQLQTRTQSVNLAAVSIYRKMCKMGSDYASEDHNMVQGTSPSTFTKSITFMKRVKRLF